MNNHTSPKKEMKFILVTTLIFVLLLTGVIVMTNSRFANIKDLPTGLVIEKGGIRHSSNIGDERATLLNGTVPISEFDVSLNKTVNMSDIIAEYNLAKSKGLMHVPVKDIKNIDLYVPRNPGDNMVRICVNATSLDEVRKGCGSIPDVTNEYVLKEGSDRLSMTKDKKFFVVKNIEGTGGQSESDWWNSSWQARKAINITPNSANLTKGFTLDVNIDTQNLIAAGKILSNGSDLRIVYWNGTANTELDRINITAFNTTNTTIEFKVQQNITNSTLNYVMYYDNKNANTAPENKSKIFYLWEDFEDQAFPFTYGTLNPTISTTSKKNGNYGIEGNGLAGYKREVKPEVLQRGMSIEGWVYSGLAGVNADLPGLEFGAQTSGEKNGYQVVLDWRSSSGGSSDLQVRKNYDSSAPIATSTENTVVANTWYYMKVQWMQNGNINVTIYDSNMNYFGSMNVNDNTYTSGYYGVCAYRSGYWDDIKTRLRVLSNPSVTMGTEELNGPGINYAAVDKSVVHVNESVNITANVTSQKGLDSVTVNITTPKNTTQIITMSNTSDIFTREYIPSVPGNYAAIILANDSNGTQSQSDLISWKAYGWAEINESYLSAHSIYQGDEVNASCIIVDANTTIGIQGYNVSFYANTSGILGSSTTNQNGTATINFVETNLGNEIITCNITDSSNLYYNKTINSSSSETVSASTPPVLTILTANIDKTLTGFGNNITITSEITSPNQIDSVYVTTTKPDDSNETVAMTLQSGDIYSGKFTNTFKTGEYNFEIVANDSSSTKKSMKLSNNLTVAANVNITLSTNSSTYGPYSNISLTTGVTGWWDGAFNYRKQFTVVNNENTILKQNYSAKIIVNTAALISQGKLLSNCDDLRIVWNNKTSSEQLDRVLETACNTNETEVWFSLQNNISASGSDNSYYLYYGKTTASNPPQDKGKVYAVYDNFENYAENSTPGNGWVDDPEFTTNDWEIKSDLGNKVVQDMTTDGVYHRLWIGSDSWDNYTIDVKAKLDNFLFSGVAFRRQPWSGSYYDQYTMITDDRAASNKLTLRRWTGGGSNYHQIAGDNTDFEGLTWHNYSISVLGNIIKISRDGKQYISKDISADSPKYLTGGSVGLMSHQGRTMFDDVKVRMLVSNPPTLTLSSEEVKSSSSEMLELGETNHQVYVLLSVQNNNTGEWKDTNILLNDSNNSDVELIGFGHSLDLSSLWESLGEWNTQNYTTGTYRVLAALTGPNGEILNNTNGVPITESAQFFLDTNAPTINIISPMNNSGYNNETVDFKYNVSSQGSINYCELIANGKQRAINYNITKDTLMNFSSILTQKDYAWEINCSNNYGSIGTTGQMQLTVVRASSFDGQTTNLANENPENITNLTIEKLNHGKIKFLQPVNLSGGADLNSHVTISNNFISIDAIALPQLEKPAVLTMYNVSFQNPVINRNGAECTNCSILSVSQSNISFSVDTFSNYSISENSKLILSDSTDSGTGAPNNNIIFYANYTNITSGSSISGASCSITFNDGSNAMNYNAGLYEYNRSFNSSGLYYFNISCDGSSQGYSVLNSTDYASINSQPGPLGVGVDVLGSERANLSGATDLAVSQAGNTTQIAVNATSITNSWQGYYGTVKGKISLKSGAGYAFYDWNISNPSGEVYITRAPDVNFATVHCADNSTIASEEVFIGQNKTDDDSVSNTFTSTTHSGFMVGLVNISANSCRSTTTYISGQPQNSDYRELLLSDGAGNLLYTSLLNGTSTGFNSAQIDFQAMVGQNGHNFVSVTPYYFFVELS